MSNRIIDMFLRKVVKVAEKRGVIQGLISPIGFEGYIEIDVKDQHGRIIHSEKGKNVVLNVGKYEVMTILRDDAWGPTPPTREIGGVVKSIARLAVGDGGADPGTLLVPKALDKTRTSLFHEVWRQDFSTLTKPTQSSIQTVTDVLSNTIPVANYNPANGGYFLNEAGLIISLPGVYVAGTSDPAEVNFTHKTFKSIDFDPALNMTATVRWTIYIVM